MVVVQAPTSPTLSSPKVSPYQGEYLSSQFLLKKVSN